MSHSMKKIEDLGEYEILDCSDEDGKDFLYFVRHAGAPQSIIRNSAAAARETAEIMERVLHVYRPVLKG